ncbi:NAD-glutamate dehydrogenase [Saccharobesus litoralis]|uniref:NAD-glutamate dehydrogenase n=1 Tax=Saccharobesus litoralis TaxID=2172099 RepID=A0A2S0VTM2_9ALTE|nr:NAD-glutamate dehydrogenase [Saccharobesus litoralis]AWB67568.1 NAD-glutamate dehydrogenase [Saccharobesus litoralis]
MSQSSVAPSIVLDNVEKLISDKISKPQSVLVKSFVQTLYRSLSHDDLIGRSDSDLYGAALSLWYSLNAHQSGSSTIRVFNPELSKHGWESSHTIVEIITHDVPFLVDSVRMALSRAGVTTHWLLHNPLKLQRENNGKVIGIGDNLDTATDKDTVFLIEIDRLSDQTIIDSITSDLKLVLEEVLLAVSDWQAMTTKLAEIINELKNSPPDINKQEIKESIAFLDWLADHKFTLMGYRQYELTPISGDFSLKQKTGSSLGLMKTSVSRKTRKLSTLPATARNVAMNKSLLVLTKTNRISRVHRPAYQDYIGIKTFDENGKVTGEHRFIGLFSSDFYNSSAEVIPLINAKLQRVMKATALTEGSHSYKAVLNILETYPRDELLQATEAELKAISLGIFQMQERGLSRLFVRKDTYGRFFSCMAYVPRERYNTQLRRATQKLLQQSFNSEREVEFTTFFSESALARTHYLVRVKDNNFEINVKQIEDNMKELAKTWEDKLEQSLLSNFSEEKGKALARKYDSAFSRSYKENILPSAAVVDISTLEALSDDNRLGMIFYRPQEEQVDSKRVKLKLFHRDEPLHLSDVLPMLENFGLRVVDESPYQITSQDGHVFWILDFSMLLTSEKELNLAASRDAFQEAFQQVWNGELEDDGFNKLVLGADLTGRQVAIIRSYAKYNRQIGTSFSQSYVEHTFSHYPHIATRLINLFEAKFDPQIYQGLEPLVAISTEIEHLLDQVANLDDDRIIRRFVEMIGATFRTNYYQVDSQGKSKSYISFKIQPEKIADVPRPLPKFEVFVYSPEVEGVHLRGGKVARGGLRWSDRREDFRTEVLGLVKAQQVKNTVIVPVGAKGGFVCKKLPTTGGRDELFELGKQCYRTFIRGLLDITDNIDHGAIVPPQNVVRHDDDDPYLVVAADKGTATFSDIANSISQEYGFWLGDAFASGGSVGYDHKKMGITARGAWESVKRHFREIGIDCQTTDFTCVGVGDMSGDVFGNGMLLSKHTRLLAAFNHMHIFIDPDPDAATSYEERKRLFALPRSGWNDYDTQLISQGGGIFERSAKSIKLTPQIKQLIGTEVNAMPPADLIKALIKMPVDLFWNGGIGTYIKGKGESHLEVGDRANDSVRINGAECRAKIIGEGGNLGCTQLGRIEYAHQGGRVDTDFIDNVGGVDCSDNEVNIKILLNTLVADGELTVKQRNKLLYDMTDEVADIVLTDCYRQTQSISITQLKAAGQLKEHVRFIHGLEKQGYLDRALEFLPSDEELSERQAANVGLTRPELSVLISYGKMVLKEQLLTDEVTQDSFICRELIEYFPKPLQERFSQAMQSHPLKSEIIATQAANQIVNDMGLNFVHRMEEETGTTPAEILISYTIAREIFDMPAIWQALEDLDNKIPAIVQTEVLFQVRRTIRHATRWFLRHRAMQLSIEQTITFFKPVFNTVAEQLPNLLVKKEAKALHDSESILINEGIDKALAVKLARLPHLTAIMDIAQVAAETERNVELVADVYFKLGDHMDLHWFLEQITAQPVANHWQALARAAFREELDWQQRSLSGVVLRYCAEQCDSQAMLDTWSQENKQVLDRWRHMLADFRTTNSHEFAKFSVALRELMLLSHHCDAKSSN